MQSSGAALIHLSTDYVFDGEKKTPYTEEDKENPINMYGASKWAGEQVVLAYNLGTVVRTSWVYSLHSKNFLAAIPRLLRTKDEPLYVENSQKNSPTFALHLVEALLALVKKNVRQDCAGMPMPEEGVRGTNCLPWTESWRKSPGRWFLFIP